MNINDQKEESWAMFCKLCKIHGKSNIFVTGRTRFKIDNLYEHCINKEHEEAIEDFITKKNMKKIVENMIISSDFKYIGLIKLVYYICKEKIAFTKFESMYELFCSVLDNSIKIKDKETHYVNSRGFIDMLEAISTIIKRKTVEKIRQSPIISVLIDESMCNSHKENLLIFVKYYDPNDLTTNIAYLSNTIVDDTKGSTIFKSFQKILDENKIFLPKVFCLGTDGAENMVSKNIGVASFFISFNPYLFNIHCWLHRLALSNKEISKEINYLDEVIHIICDIYNYFNKSAVRNKLLKERQIELDEDEVSILKMHEIRWLSLYRCVRNILKSLNSALLVLDDNMETYRGKKFQKNSDDYKFYQKYNCILKEMLSFRFLAFFNFLSDILYDISQLCLLFQSDNIDYSEAFEALDACLNMLKNNYLLSNNFGENYNKFYTDFKKDLYLPEFNIEHSKQMEEQTIQLMKQFAECLYNNLKRRFVNKELTENFKIFTIENIRSLKQENETVYRRQELENLIEHYGFDKVYLDKTYPAIIVTEEVRNEWRLLKSILRCNYTDKSEKDIWPLIINIYGAKYPNITKLILIKLILPLTTVQCERGFSALNFIKNDYRSRLGKIHFIFILIS